LMFLVFLIEKLDPQKPPLSSVPPPPPTAENRTSPRVCCFFPKKPTHGKILATSRWSTPFPDCPAGRPLLWLNVRPFFFPTNENREPKWFPGKPDQVDPAGNPTKTSFGKTNQLSFFRARRLVFLYQGFFHPVVRRCLYLCR